jgi:hypothetical protein
MQLAGSPVINSPAFIVGLHGCQFIVKGNTRNQWRPAR